MSHLRNLIAGTFYNILVDCRDLLIQNQLRGIASMALAGVLCLTLSCGSSGSGGGSAPTPPPSAPVITRLTAAKSPITIGKSTTITAVFSGGSGSLDHGVGTITSGTPVNISPTVDTTYTLTVTGSGGTATKDVTVTIVAAPVITAFTAAPGIITVGHGTVLACAFTGGTGLIDQGVGAVTSGDTRNVSPAANLTYRLTVTNAAGDSAHLDAGVLVVAAPVITHFTATPSSLAAGGSSLLACAFTGGTGVITPGDHAIASGGTWSVSPSATTEYTFAVTNAAGDTDTRKLTVSVGNSLAVAITGLTGLNADVTVTGPGSFSQHLIATKTLTDLSDGDYTITSATVTDAAQPGLGRGTGGTLGSEFLQRYPLKSVQTITISGSSAMAAVDYPPATLTLQIPTKENAAITVPIDFVLVPAGSFTMGSNDPIDSTWWTATPTHTVSFQEAFYMGTTGITQAQWKAVLGVTNNPSFFNGDTLPVEQVSWDMIRNPGTGFLDQFNAALTGYGFRLPSEAEYEYACRAGTTTAYFFGADSTNLSTYAWWSGNSGSTTHAVGTKAPNPWGLYDIIGNVWQWPEDDGHNGYTGAPVDGSAWVDTPTRARGRVLRGGSWDYYPYDYIYRSAIRLNGWPENTLDCGFRVSLPVPRTH